MSSLSTLTILSDEARKLLVKWSPLWAADCEQRNELARGAQKALASMGLDPDGKPLTHAPPEPEVKVGQVWQRPDGIALKVARISDGLSKGNGLAEMSHGYCDSRIPEPELLREWRLIRHADGSEVGP